MRTPIATRLAAFGLVLGLSLALAPSARAEGEEEGHLDEASKKVKEQMEKVLELMRRNEEALIQISTGARDEPRRVDVEVPDVPPAEGASGAAGGSDSSGGPGPAGESGTAGGAEGSRGRGGEASGGTEAVRGLEEIIRGQRSASGRIPGELEELVRMVPQ